MDNLAQNLPHSLTHSLLICLKSLHLFFIRVHLSLLKSNFPKKRKSLVKLLKLLINKIIPPLYNLRMSFK